MNIVLLGSNEKEEIEVFTYETTDLYIEKYAPRSTYFYFRGNFNPHADERFAGKGCRCVAGYGKGRRLRIAGIYC